jgi:hypothetical protein
VQCDVVQQGPQFGGVLRHKRLKVEPFSAPALIKVDHPADRIATQSNTPRSSEPHSGTHEGHWRQEGMDFNPVTCVVSAGLGLTVFRDLSRGCPGSRRRAGGVKLERPQPRSGEDERAGR